MIQGKNKGNLGRKATLFLLATVLSLTATLLFTACSGDLHEQRGPETLYIIGGLEGNNCDRAVAIYESSKNIYEGTFNLLPGATCKFIKPREEDGEYIAGANFYPGDDWENVDPNYKNARQYNLNNAVRGECVIRFDIKKEEVKCTPLLSTSRTVSTKQYLYGGVKDGKNNFIELEKVGNRYYTQYKYERHKKGDGCCVTEEKANERNWGSPSGFVKCTLVSMKETDVTKENWWEYTTSRYGTGYDDPESKAEYCHNAYDFDNPTTCFDLKDKYICQAGPKGVSQEERLIKEGCFWIKGLKEGQLYDVLVRFTDEDDVKNPNTVLDRFLDRGLPVVSFTEADIEKPIKKVEYTINFAIKNFTPNQEYFINTTSYPAGFRTWPISKTYTDTGSADYNFKYSGNYHKAKLDAPNNFVTTDSTGYAIFSYKASLGYKDIEQGLYALEGLTGDTQHIDDLQVVKADKNSKGPGEDRIIFKTNRITYEVKEGDILITIDKTTSHEETGLNYFVTYPTDLRSSSVKSTWYLADYTQTDLVNYTLTFAIKNASPNTEYYINGTPWAEGNTWKGGWPIRGWNDKNIQDDYNARRYTLADAPTRFLVTDSSGAGEFINIASMRGPIGKGSVSIQAISSSQLGNFGVSEEYNPAWEFAIDNATVSYQVVANRNILITLYGDHGYDIQETELPTANTNKITIKDDYNLRSKETKYKAGSKVKFLKVRASLSPKDSASGGITYKWYRARGTSKAGNPSADEEDAYMSYVDEKGYACFLPRKEGLYYCVATNIMGKSPISITSKVANITTYTTKDEKNDKVVEATNGNSMVVIYCKDENSGGDFNTVAGEKRGEFNCQLVVFTWKKNPKYKPDLDENGKMIVGDDGKPPSVNSKDVPYEIEKHYMATGLGGTCAVVFIVPNDIDRMKLARIDPDYKVKSNKTGGEINSETTIYNSTSDIRYYNGRVQYDATLHNGW